MSDNIAIKVTDVHKSFRLPTERAWGLKQAIFNRLKGIKGYKEQQVLRGISFDVKQGEFLGIVGLAEIPKVGAYLSFLCLLFCVFCLIRGIILALRGKAMRIPFFGKLVIVDFDYFYSLDE